MYSLYFKGKVEKIPILKNGNMKVVILIAMNMQLSKIDKIKYSTEVTDLLITKLAKIEDGI